MKITKIPTLLHVRVYYWMKVLSPFCGSLLTSASWVDRPLISHCDWAKVVLFFKQYCILLRQLLCMTKWYYFVLNAAYDKWFLTTTYIMTPLHSLVDGLNFKNRCFHKEGVTLWCCDLSTPQAPPLWIRKWRGIWWRSWRCPNNLTSHHKLNVTLGQIPSKINQSEMLINISLR